MTQIKPLITFSSTFSFLVFTFTQEIKTLAIISDFISGVQHPLKKTGRNPKSHTSK